MKDAQILFELVMSQPLVAAAIALIAVGLAALLKAATVAAEVLTKRWLTPASSPNSDLIARETADEVPQPKVSVSRQIPFAVALLGGLVAALSLALWSVDTFDGRDVQGQACAGTSLFGFVSGSCLPGTPDQSVKTGETEAGAGAHRETHDYVNGLNLTVFATNAPGVRTGHPVPSSPAGLNNLGTVFLENPLPFRLSSYAADPRISSRFSKKVEALVWNGFLSIKSAGTHDLEIVQISPYPEGCSATLTIDGIAVYQVANVRWETKPDQQNVVRFTSDEGFYPFELFFSCHDNYAWDAGQVQSLLPVENHGAVGLDLRLFLDGGEGRPLGGRDFWVRRPDN